MESVGSGILTGDISSVEERKRQRHEKRHEKVNNCCCGIFTALWESRHKFYVGIGVVSVVLACMERDFVIAILALKCLLCGCWGWTSTVQAQEAEEEYDEVIKPLLDALVLKIDQWPKTKEDLSFEEAKKIFPELLNDVININSHFKNSQSTLLKKKEIVVEVLQRDAERYLMNTEDPTKNRNFQEERFTQTVCFLLAHTARDAKGLIELMPRYFAAKKDQDLF